MHALRCEHWSWWGSDRDWCFVAEKPAPAPHLQHPAGCAALRVVLVTVPRVSRSCEHFPDGFDLHLLEMSERDTVYTEQPDWQIPLSENGKPLDPTPQTPNPQP